VAYPDIYGDSVKRRERRTARVTITPQLPATSITLTACVAWLYNRDTGLIAGGVEGSTAGFTAGAQAASDVTLDIEPLVQELLAGPYQLFFKATDSLGGIHEPMIEFRVVDDGA